MEAIIVVEGDLQKMTLEMMRKWLTFLEQQINEPLKITSG
jgi:hypothetical protein